MTQRHTALIYARLSNRERGEAGNISPTLQIAKCQHVASERGYIVNPQSYQDDGDIYLESEGKHSARSRRNLPAWRALEQRMQTDASIAAVIAYDLSRAFRNTEAMLKFARICQQHNIKLIFALDGEVDIRTATGKMLTTVKAAFAEHYSHYVSERLLDHFAALRAKGVYAGHRAPFGLKRIGNAPNISFEPTKDLRVIRAWLELYTSRDIGTPEGARQMNLRGYQWKDRTGKPRPVSVWDLIQTLEILETYKPFLDAKLYHRALTRRAQRANRSGNGNLSTHPPHLLKGLLYCVCGARYVSANETLKSGDIGQYYRHAYLNLDCPHRRKTVARKIDAQIWKRLERLNQLSDADKNDIAQKIATPPQEDTHEDSLLKRQRLETALREAEAALIYKDITRERFLELKTEILLQLEELQPTEAETLNIVPTLEEARAMLEDLTSALRDASTLLPEQTNLLMRDIFTRIVIQSTEIVDVQVNPRLKNYLPLC